MSDDFDSSIPVGSTGNKLPGAIGGAVINNQQLKIGIALGKNRIKSRANIPELIVTGDTDAQTR
jgi:hypothetical protein